MTCWRWQSSLSISDYRFPPGRGRLTVRILRLFYLDPFLVTGAGEFYFVWIAGILSPRHPKGGALRNVQQSSAADRKTFLPGVPEALSPCGIHLHTLFIPLVVVQEIRSHGIPTTSSVDRPSHSINQSESCSYRSNCPPRPHIDTPANPPSTST